MSHLSRPPRGQQRDKPYREALRMEPEMRSRYRHRFQSSKRRVVVAQVVVALAA